MAKHNDGMKVSNLYIAQIKQKHGIIERENYNKPKSEKGRQPECPKEKEIAEHGGGIEMANKIVREIIHAKGIDIGIYTKDF